MAIGMRAQPKRLFGQPAQTYGTPGIGDDIERNRTLEEAPPGLGMRSAEPKKKKGIFGSGILLGDVVGIAGDAVAINRGMTPMFAASNQKQSESLAAQQRAESERLAARGEYAWKSEYDRANPKPTNNDTVADYEFIKQNLGDKAAAEFLKNKANPPVHRVGPDGQFYRVDVGGQGASASSVNITEDMWNSGEPVGGPQSQSAGGFRP